MATGARHQSAIVAESTYGVTPATPVWQIIRHTGNTIGMEKNALESAELRADRKVVVSRHGVRQTNGDLNVEFSYGSFDTLLEALMCGTWTADVLTGGINRRSFSMQRHFQDLAAGGQYIRITGLEANTMALKIAAEEMLTATFGMVGKDAFIESTETTGSTYTPATTTQPMDAFSGTLTIDAVAVAVITEINLEVDNGIEPRFVVGSKTTIDPSIMRQRVRGSMTAYFEDSNSGSLIDNFYNEVEKAVVFTTPDLDGNSYTFNMPRVKFNSGKPDISGDGPIMLSIDFEALASETAYGLEITRVAA